MLSTVSGNRRSDLLLEACWRQLAIQRSDIGFLSCESHFLPYSGRKNHNVVEDPACSRHVSMFTLNTPKAADPTLRMLPPFSPNGGGDVFQLQISEPNAMGKHKRGAHAVGCTPSTLMFISLIMTVLVLCILTFSLLFISYRISTSITFLYYTSEPYMRELTARGMSIVRNAEQSSSSMNRSMAAADAAVAQSLPALLAAVNQTTGMLARLERVSRNPVLKLSVA